MMMMMMKKVGWFWVTDFISMYFYNYISQAEDARDEECSAMYSPGAHLWHFDGHQMDAMVFHG